MNKLIDKLVVLIVCLALYIPAANRLYMIVPILTAIILSAAISYLENERITIPVFAAYLIACFFQPVLLFFIPLIAYDAAFLKSRGVWALSYVPLIFNYVKIPDSLSWLIAAFILAAYVLRCRTVSFDNIERDYHRLRDTAKEISMQLEKQNKELLEKQDYEINLATVTERNRIARDIHDNVGHLLSRSILQIGALLAINKDDATNENLRLVKDTLSEAMDSIRASVHDLHEKSIDLQTEMQKLIDGFTFCPVRFDYDVEANLDKNIKHCFIAVMKEALSNIIKHSDATNIIVAVREHPAFYQLIIQDNGTSDGYNSENGIGLKNIADRVAAVGGNINISTGAGFRIFISVPK
jgi:signal transduction histidine kinase